MNHVVLVLANLMDREGTLNQETAARVNLASEVFWNNSANRIMFIGWDYRTDSKIAICDAMADYCMAAHEIENEAILRNPYSRDTVGDAVLSRVQLERRFRQFHLSVVTTDYHLSRVQKIFRVVYGPKYNISFYGNHSGDAASKRMSEMSSEAAFASTFSGIRSGDLPKFVHQLQVAHPFYDGTCFPERPLPQAVLEISNLSNR